MCVGAWARFEPCEASLRAVREAKAALEKAGHTMVPLEPPKDGWEVSAHRNGMNLKRLGGIDCIVWPERRLCM
jgi:hypothetical protein